MCQRYKKKHH